MTIIKKSIYSISKIMMSVSVLVAFSVPCLAKNSIKMQPIIEGDDYTKVPRVFKKRENIKRLAASEVAERITTVTHFLQQTDALVGKFYEVQVPVLTRCRVALEELAAKKGGAAKKDAEHQLAIFNAKYYEIKGFVQNEGPKLRVACVNNNADAPIAYQMYLSPFVTGLEEYASYAIKGKTNPVYEKIFKQWAEEINK